MRRSTRLARDTVVEPSITAPTAPAEPVRAKREETPFKDDTSLPAAPSRPLTSSPRKRKLDDIQSLPPLLPRDKVEQCTILPRTAAPFSLDKAREHLCTVDKRFIPLFDNTALKAYQDNGLPLNLYRTITRSVLGQQISWLAARSISHKFIRLFHPGLPENPDETEWFPSPLDVLEADDASLRAAGLSISKIAYVRDISRRFADGRFDVRRIANMNADECIDTLTEAKGVGRWTAEMMLMFALRHPDVLPTGDLGVQRGMLSFFLACECGPKLEETGIECTCGGKVPQPPEGGPTTSLLASRAQGKKTAKKKYLDPNEMHALADSWAPYRAVGTMFMWKIK